MLPDRYWKRHGAKDMEIGRRGWFEATVLRFDQDHRLWLHPRARAVPGPATPAIRDPTRPPIVEFEAVAGERGRPAFRITIHPVHLGDHRWETREPPTPDEASGLEWLAVPAVDEAPGAADDAVVG